MLENPSKEKTAATSNLGKKKRWKTRRAKEGYVIVVKGHKSQIFRARNFVFVDPVVDDGAASKPTHGMKVLKDSRVLKREPSSSISQEVVVPYRFKSSLSTYSDDELVAVDFENQDEFRRLRHWIVDDDTFSEVPRMVTSSKTLVLPLEAWKIIRQMFPDRISFQENRIA
jgi:hypothetical protein